MIESTGFGSNWLTAKVIRMYANPPARPAFEVAVNIPPTNRTGGNIPIATT
jgi:hypothetical protein